MGVLRNALTSWSDIGSGLLLMLFGALSLSPLFSWAQWGTTARVRLGLTLALVAVLIMLFNGWKGGEMVFRHRVAVYDESQP